MLPWSTELRGRFDEHVVESELLCGNPLGDPHRRPLWVYVPPGYDDDPERRYPSVYVLQGLTGQLDMWRNRNAFRRNFPELVDELAAPSLVVFVDAWTSLGGSQFIDSPGTGRYGSYLCDEVVAFVDERYRTLAEPAHRGVMGKSSGGYGAMVTPMLRPDRFRALATRARVARPVRRLVRPVLGGLPLAAGVRAEDRPRAPERVVHGRLLLDRRGRDRAAAVRARDRQARAGDLGALARVGPGADGGAACRGASGSAGDLRRRGEPRRAVPRPRRGGLPPRARRDRRHRRL